MRHDSRSNRFPTSGGDTIGSCCHAWQAHKVRRACALGRSTMSRVWTAGPCGGLGADTLGVAPGPAARSRTRARGPGAAGLGRSPLRSCRRSVSVLGFRRIRSMDGCRGQPQAGAPGVFLPRTPGRRHAGTQPRSGYGTASCPRPTAPSPRQPRSGYGTASCPRPTAPSPRPRNSRGEYDEVHVQYLPRRERAGRDA
jgi:hypothetical protein